MPRNSGIRLYEKAKSLIPGGTQLLSKRPEMFLPGIWPSYYSRCKGIDVWDLDGKKYHDFTIAGVGGCPLGYADPDVDAAVIRALKSGNMCTLNAPEEVELAELLVKLHPWSSMVRYARTGGEAMAIAVRICRAYRGKDKVLFCGYHGWHDWYLSANIAGSRHLDGQLLPGLEPLGVCRGLRGTALPFEYNNPGSFRKLFMKHRNELAAVVMEPVRSVWPVPGFLEGIRSLTARYGVPLVFDEVTSGWRMAAGGIHLKLKIEPDVCVLAKALGNGYPMAAVIGTSKVMAAAQGSFISSTYWTDRIGPAAALAMIRKFIRIKAHTRMTRIGKLVQEGIMDIGARLKMPLRVSGIYPLTHWSIQSPQSQLLHTIVARRMLEKGYLTSKAFYATTAHTEAHVAAYLRELEKTLAQVKGYLSYSPARLRQAYPGEAAHSGFKRLV